MMGYRFEFDSVNKILLLRVEGRFTEELLTEIYRVSHRYWAATDSKTSIADFSSVTEVAVSTEFLRGFANREPVGDAPLALSLPRPHFYLASLECFRFRESVHGLSGKSCIPLTRRSPPWARNPRTSTL